MNLFDAITSLFAPDECLSCRREGSLLCSNCTGRLIRPRGICFACYTSVEGIVCATCLTKTGCLTLQAATDYADIAKQLVANLKFAGNQSAALIMARHLASLCTALPDRPLVVYMPATTQHVRERGYDQAALLAKHTARLLGAEHTTLLARFGKRHQLGTGREERLQQVTATVRVRNPARVLGRNVVLIDDVLTTGASIRAATRVLLRAGALRVDALVFAQSIKINKTS